MIKSLLKESEESIDTMDEDSKKDESKDKLFLQFEQELNYLSTYIAV